ncbi:MAG: CocE/NonD family hydrolase [Rhodospirillaceae bacterium]|nr:CocE/NonD family hydrolase [Rhodospirillaceae bacterium]MBT4772483.1 CocE/NonD family hydrolase [Rhodospirillaceae bacterium]MBT5358923.1 CocE/NonD family hydrolase [Rhodospirillaceae bacterium]MBT5769609.1 CocE/NonD family hydrolase [Rhodospirillaceae bacterium]MBT6309286.1 CocE/NonD family hydrolase [Rhodospirillaceae bacterium]
MRVDWDVPIEMDDGLVLRANIYRPDDDGTYPVVMSHGPYGKDLHFEEIYQTCWDLMCENHPDVPAGSTNIHQSWEVADPEKWVPKGFVIIRVDSRGAGRSPGYLEHWSPRETQDFAVCIDWAGVQPWSNGKVGLSGISYYAVNQWQVAALQPKHLAAICPWEGFNDFYRELAYQGGIYNSFARHWYDMQILKIQHGYGDRGWASRANGELAAGPVTLSNEELAANRYDLYQAYISHPLDSDWYQALTPDLSKVEVPVLSCANWGGAPLHPRGNFNGFTQVSSKHKWLEVHGLEHWSLYYTDYGNDLQMRFFERFLRGDESAWPDDPRVQLLVRHPGEKFVPRSESDWPIPRTELTKFHFEPAGQVLSENPASTAAEVSYAAMGDGVTFLSSPVEDDLEICGPMAVKLNISSDTKDADLFVILRVFQSDMKEVTFRGALDPHTPVASGWLRASHRKLDPERSTEAAPFHTNDEVQELTPGEVYEVDVEIHASGIVVPKGYRFGLSIKGCDYVYPGETNAGLSNMKNVFTGVGPFLHDDPDNRPAEVFDNNVTVHLGGENAGYVLLPVIPAE